MDEGQSALAEFPLGKSHLRYPSRHDVELRRLLTEPTKSWELVNCFMSLSFETVTQQ